METLTRTNKVAGYDSPWFAYKRNTGASCTGAVIYRGGKRAGTYPARYEGGLFYADFARKSVRFAPVAAGAGRPGEGEAFLQGMTAGPVRLVLGPDASLYILTHGGATKASGDDAMLRVAFGR
jgi:glucose/arabinose dehydrogenase